MPRGRRYPAAYVLSMVFKICRPELPRAGMSVRERPCLELVLPLVLRQASEVLSLSLPLAQPYIVPNEPEPQLSKHAVSERTPMVLPRAFQVQC